MVNDKKELIINKMFRNENRIQSTKIMKVNKPNEF